MKILNHTQSKLVSGGTSCKDALIADVTTWDVIDITQFCSKEQFTVYAFGWIDLMYSVGLVNITDEMAVDMIQGLSI